MAKSKYRWMFETQKVCILEKFRKEWSQHQNKCKSQMQQDQVSGGVSVLWWLAAPILFPMVFCLCMSHLLCIHVYTCALDNSLYEGVGRGLGLLPSRPLSPIPFSENFPLLPSLPFSPNFSLLSLLPLPHIPRPPRLSCIFTVYYRYIYPVHSTVIYSIYRRGI